MDFEDVILDLTHDHLTFTTLSYGIIAKKTDKNFITGPFVLELLLILLRLGSKDNSTAEIRKVLKHHDCPVETIRQIISSVTFSLKEKTKFVSFDYAQKFYIKNSAEIKEDFKNMSVNEFNVDIEKMDFSSNTESAKTINSWIKSKTKNGIEDIIKPEQLNSWTCFVLLSGLYFEGEWSQHFPKRLTKISKFYKNGKKQIDVETMICSAIFNYYELDEVNAQVLELQLKSLGASLVIVLPKKKDGLSKIEKKIAVAFHVGRGDFLKEYVEVAVPKFKIQNKFNFKEIMKRTGIHKIFRMEDTDLSGIAGNPKELYVNEIFQKVCFSMEEDGICKNDLSGDDVVMVTNASLTPGKIKQFTVDHPFLFYVRMKEIIILVGRVLDPSYNEYVEI